MTYNGVRLVFEGKTTTCYCGEFFDGAPEQPVLHLLYIARVWRRTMDDLCDRILQAFEVVRPYTFDLPPLPPLDTRLWAYDVRVVSPANIVNMGGLTS